MSEAPETPAERWAMLSNTTLSPLQARLRQQLREAGVEPALHTAEYGDAARQILDPASELYRFDPQWAIVHFDIELLHPNITLDYPFLSEEDQAQLEEKLLVDLLTMVRGLASRTNAKLLVSGFAAPPRTPLGVGIDPAFRNALRRMHLALADELAELPQAQLVDLDALWSEAGWQDRDERFRLMAQFPFGPGMQDLLVAHWLRYWRAQRGMSRKVVVVDLDNTLWRGILGEDGADGIEMGDDPRGRPFRELQLALKALSRRGVVLAICSKNNESDAKPVLESHPDMVLRLEDFAAWRINWRDKATNLREIAAELNLGLQHFVFLDDNPAEREWVRTSLPDVLVPEFPEDTSLYAGMLVDCQLDTLSVTEEDRRRGQMYREERERREFQADASDYDAFLAELDLEAEILPLSAATLDRAAQMCQRTNQFNLTTRRHSAEDLRRLVDSDDACVLLLRARDRFGDYGFSGLAIARRLDGTAEIDSFLVSCRVLGKRLEQALFEALRDWAQASGCTRLRGRHIPTAKNALCKDFLADCGLKRLEDTDDATVFEHTLADLERLELGHIRIRVSETETGQAHDRHPADHR